MPKLQKAPLFETREAFDKAIDEIAELDLKIQKLKTAQDLWIQKIRDKYEPQLNPLESKIEKLMAKAQTYADEHKEAIFKKRKRSAETTLATFGFRKGKEVLVLNPEVTWEDVVNNLKDFEWEAYIETKETPNKNEIKKDFDEDELLEIGCALERRETFFVKPKDPGAVAHN